jgi:amidase
MDSAQVGVRGLVGETASHIAGRVRSGDADPMEIIQAHIENARTCDLAIRAFRSLRPERAIEEAAALAARSDLADLPLAGVPVAIKDNVCVAGESMRNGSPATPDTPCVNDHEIVRRLRAAGAIVLGLTNVPELSVWGTSDGPFGDVRNPWNPDRTAGGSSGGSAASVAAGMVPIAHGNDAAGSIRIPAACCGLFGIKPGHGVVPAGIGPTSWFGMAENGALASTVDDAALMLAVLAYRGDLRSPEPPGAPLRIAVSIRTPLPGTRMDAQYRAAPESIGEMLAREGHDVETSDPPYSMRLAMPILARWFAGTAQDAAALNPDALQKRTRTHVRMGRLAVRMGLVHPADVVRWHQRAMEFFRRHDILITPALAAPPIPRLGWDTRSWIANLSSNAMYAPFCAPWNLAGFPACSVPAGFHSNGLPLAVQLVAGPGGEGVLLAVARQIEQLRPWPRHAGPNPDSGADPRHKEGTRDVG